MLAAYSRTSLGGFPVNNAGRECTLFPLCLEIFFLGAFLTSLGCSLSTGGWGLLDLDLRGCEGLGNEDLGLGLGEGVIGMGSTEGNTPLLRRMKSGTIRTLPVTPVSIPPPFFCLNISSTGVSLRIIGKIRFMSSYHPH